MGGPPGLLAVGDDLALDGRFFALGTTERLRHLRTLIGALVLVFVLGLAGQRVLELAHARAQGAPQAGQPLGPEDDEHDQQDDRELWDSDAVEHFCASKSIPRLHTRDYPSRWSSLTRGGRS